MSSVIFTLEKKKFLYITISRQKNLLCFYLSAKIPRSKRNGAVMNLILDTTRFVRPIVDVHADGGYINAAISFLINIFVSHSFSPTLKVEHSFFVSVSFEKCFKNKPRPVVFCTSRFLLVEAVPKSMFFQFLERRQSLILVSYKFWN